MNEAPRLFGPRIAKRKPVPNDTPKLAVDSLGEEVAHASGKDSEIAELNAHPATRLRVPGPGSEISPGIREADNEPRELCWTFYTEKCFDR